MDIDEIINDSDSMVECLNTIMEKHNITFKEAADVINLILKRDHFGYFTDVFSPLFSDYFLEKLDEFKNLKNA